MAHHQRHGMNFDSHASQTMKARPAASCNPTISTISDDEAAAEADEPPDSTHPLFTKTLPRAGLLRRNESLLTKAFHTDSESHDDDHKLTSTISHNPSVSSTCSTFSVRSAGDFTSDDGHTSPGTRASTPSSPRSAVAITFPSRQGSESSKSSQAEGTNKLEEKTVEAELNRRRCISFACGRKDPNSTAATKDASQSTVTAPEPPKRACAIKFLCPSRVVAAPKSPIKDGHARPARLHSPAPPPAKSATFANSKRGHRDSDATIKNESSRAPSPAVTSTKTSTKERRMSNPTRTEATRFHEFASSDDEVEDWIRESTCHRSRLTVTDTLQKENVIRQLAEEAEEEAMEEEEQDEDEDDLDDTQTDFFSGEEEDAGFQTDDEEGFAASDDDSEDDSDYEWWAPRRSTSMSPFIPSNFFRPSAHRNGSDSSLDIDSPSASPKQRVSPVMKRKPTHPVVIRSTTSELPDSTDFVCGTLDEDRPLEQAYLNTRKQREAAKHRPVPQDIDPTFPTSDPELEKEEEEEVTDEEDEVDDIEQENASESDEPAGVHGPFEADNEEYRGRKHQSSISKRSPQFSPRRLRSPPAPTAKRGRSPAPRGMFHGSPKRLRSPPPPNRLTSPPPSRRASAAGSLEAVNIPTLSQTLLGNRNHDLTHTSSLPRSPPPFSRRRKSSTLTAVCEPAEESDADEDDTEATNDKPYARGAIDIVQGLEQKRLKRREKLYKQYWKREEKKKHYRRPQPGKGAERMKQVGIECAVYRGKRIISI